MKRKTDPDTQIPGQQQLLLNEETPAGLSPAEVKNALLQKIHQLLPETKDIEKVAKTLKIISELYGNATASPGPSVYTLIHDAILREKEGES